MLYDFEQNKNIDTFGITLKYVGDDLYDRLYIKNTKTTSKTVNYFTLNCKTHILKELQQILDMQHEVVYKETTTMDDC